MNQSHQDALLGRQLIIDDYLQDRSPLLQRLQAAGLFTVDTSVNALNLPVDRALADQLGCAQYCAEPIASYREGILGQLEKIQNATYGQAAMQGDEAGLRAAAEAVENLQLTIKLMLINGDLFLSYDT